MTTFKDRSLGDRPKPRDPETIDALRLSPDKRNRAITPSVLVELISMLSPAISEASQVYKDDDDVVVKALHAGAEFDMHTRPCAQTWFIHVVLSALYVNRKIGDVTL